MKSGATFHSRHNDTAQKRVERYKRGVSFFIIISRMFSASFQHHHVLLKASFPFSFSFYSTSRLIVTNFTKNKLAIIFLSLLSSNYRNMSFHALLFTRLNRFAHNFNSRLVVVLYHKIKHRQKILIKLAQLIRKAL